MQVEQEIALEGFIFGKVKVKVKVTGVKCPNNGPISVCSSTPPRFLVRSPSNLVGGCRDGSRGQRSRSFLERSRSMGTNG